MAEPGIIKNKEIYNQMFNSGKGSGFIYEPVLDLIMGIIEKGKYKNILDYGCGNGRFGFYFKKCFKDKKLTGVDISEEALKTCSSIYDEVCLMDGLTLPDKKFDFVVMNSVLEHIPLNKWDIFLGAIISKLEAGGGIFMIFPNKNSPARVFFKRWIDEEGKLGHISLVDFVFLRKKLRESGFKKLKSSFFFPVRRLPDYVACPGFLKAMLAIPYSLVNLYPFYYLRDSFWIFAKKA